MKENVVIKGREDSLHGGTGEVIRKSEGQSLRDYSLHTLTDLKPGNHLCNIYRTEEEHREVIVPFLRTGLAGGEKVLYIVHSHTAEEILGYLQEDGLEVEPYLESGQLLILTANKDYMRDGVSDPDRMIILLRAETERAMEEGYSALRITDEMTWASQGMTGSERLIEYEEKLNKFSLDSRCLALCQYDKRRFDSKLLLDVLAVHKIVIVGTEIYDNFYYESPTKFFNQDPASVRLHHWLDNLAERKKAEEALIAERSKLKLMLKHERFLASVASRLHSTKSFYKAMEELLAQIEDIVKIDRVEIYVANNKYSLTFEHKSGKGKTVFPRIRNFEDLSIYNLPRLVNIIEKGEIFILSDLSKLEENEKDAFIKEDICAALIVPIIIADEPMGVICFSQKHTYSWKPEVYELLNTITNIIASAFEKDFQFKARLEAEKKQTEAIKLVEKSSRLASIGTLAAGISHEINQPLTALIAMVDGILFCEEMGQEKSKNEIIKNLNFISEQAARIDGVIKQMRNLIREEKDEKFSLVNINEEIHKSLRLIREQISVCGIKVNYDLDELLPFVMISPTQMEQVILNLVLNAIHALDLHPKKNKMIFISTRFFNGNCLLDIADNGPGILNNNLKQIFNPFYTTKTDSGGLGLGLTITQNIISNLGGTISVKNRREGGAHFTITIPAASKNLSESL